MILPCNRITLRAEKALRAISRVTDVDARGKPSTWFPRGWPCRDGTTQKRCDASFHSFALPMRVPLVHSNASSFLCKSVSPSSSCHARRRQEIKTTNRHLLCNYKLSANFVDNDSICNATRNLRRACAKNATQRDPSQTMKYKQQAWGAKHLSRC